MQDADGVLKWFAEEAPAQGVYGSAHYVVGLHGNVIQMIPDGEMAYHVGSKFGYTTWALDRLSGYPNDCTIGIEMCVQDAEGNFTDETFDATATLIESLLLDHHLDPWQDVFTHQGVVGWKQCPLWFATHPWDFDGLRYKIDEGLGR